MDTAVRVETCLNHVRAAMAGIPAGERVVVAMSGGVDSAVAAVVLHQIGYEVIGLTMRLYHTSGAKVRNAKACCGTRDQQDAALVAGLHDFPHYTLDYEKLFKQAVIDDFVRDYLHGSTPVPCIRCNERVKFRDLIEQARELGGKCLVTGHYVRRLQDGSLACARDPDKDQSYFLFTTTKAQLGFLRFPLGALHKTDVRMLAQHFKLPLAQKPESQDICFVPDGDYAAFVRRWAKESDVPGDIRHIDGRILGRHTGVAGYTIGQRRGLGIAAEAPLYVVAIDPACRLVHVGPKEALYCASISVSDVNWIGPAPLRDFYRVWVRIRSSGKRLAARLRVRPAGIDVLFDVPEERTAPGQACVFYEKLPQESGWRVLGGGWIKSCAEIQAGDAKEDAHGQPVL